MPFRDEYADAPDSVRLLAHVLMLVVAASERATPGFCERLRDAADDAEMKAKVVRLFGERLSATVLSDLSRASRLAKGLADMAAE